jgi:hypothetical protein
MIVLTILPDIDWPLKAEKPNPKALSINRPSGDKSQFVACRLLIVNNFVNKFFVPGPIPHPWDLLIYPAPFLDLNGAG